MSINALYITNLGLLDNLGQTQILPYMEGLAKKGIKIYVLSFEKIEKLEDISYVENIKERLNSWGIEWERLLYHRRWGNLRDIFTGLIKTLKIVVSKKISILHARATIPILIVWPIAKILKRKIIYDRRGTMVGDFVDDVNIKNIFSIRFFSLIVNAIDRFIMRHSDVVVVLSQRLLERLEGDPYFSNAHTAIEYVPCCTDISRFNNNFKRNLNLNLDGKIVMTYIGSLGTCYLLKEMCEFFKILKQEKENALFLIISHTDKRFIEDILRRQRLVPELDYAILEAEPNEVPCYLAKSDFSIMFIKDVDCKIGSSPTKFGESLASGVPIVVNKGIGDTEDIIRTERVGAIVEALDSDSYKEAIARILSFLNERDSLKNRCFETATRYFSLDLGIERYREIYTRLENDI